VCYVPVKQPRKPLSIRLNPAVVPRLDTIAEAEELTRSAVVRHLLRLGIDAYEKGPQPRWNR
jgi:predicted transcriptional regulator